MARKGKNKEEDNVNREPAIPTPRGYQQEMLEESLRRNLIIALDTGSGKTHIAILRIKIEIEREPTKVCWFLAPTVALCQQQRDVIAGCLATPVGMISGSMEPNQWKNAELWLKLLRNHKIMVTTPQVLLDALRHGYVNLRRNVSLLVFDEAHHAVDNHPYNRIMIEFYFAYAPSADSGRLPYILGLTASPIYGGNVEHSFMKIERNLDSTIRAPRIHKEELSLFVHRPKFRHFMYDGPDEKSPPFSTNLATLVHIRTLLHIDNDPYVKSLRKKLLETPFGSPEYLRIDQKLSKTVKNDDSFTHRGLRDFERTATVICHELGPWAADWYVWTVVQQARKAVNPFNNIITNWRDTEKRYMLGIIEQLKLCPPSYFPDDIVADSSDKVRALIDILLNEKLDAEGDNESYSSLIFVQRRDVVIALAEVLKNHPVTGDMFRFGALLGSSDDSRRHSFLDITRTLLKETQEETLQDFRIGVKTVIIATSVAEEGLDIQACGSVIRWDPPENMASWAQSRGRARRKKSTFTLMFARGDEQKSNVAKWEETEREMVALYNDPSRDMLVDSEQIASEEDETDEAEFRIHSTGAVLTLHSAVSHLSHFCAVIPSSSHADNRPVYDTDPPEMPEGWHSWDNRSTTGAIPYQGPFGSTVTLPRTLPLPTRIFTVDRIYRTRISAHRHAAFTAYKTLYDADLLNEHLLPMTSVMEPEPEEDVRVMLQDVEKRAGTARVLHQIDPWEAVDGCPWWIYELQIGDLPPLLLFIKSQAVQLPNDVGPTLYRAGQEPIATAIRKLGMTLETDERISRAKLYTRMIFWSINGSRMAWENLNFAYLFLPLNGEDDEWVMRRTWLANRDQESNRLPADSFVANAAVFGEQFSHPTDLFLVRAGFQFAKGFQFIRWRFETLSEEEEVELRTKYKRLEDLQITYPLLEVAELPQRTNFLLPTPINDEKRTPPRLRLLLPHLSAVAVLSREEVQHAFLLPSILRSLSMTITVDSLRENFFCSLPLYHIPSSLLLVAITAPLSQEKFNYQRMETLGDTVLKMNAGIQLLAQYPTWHEGYLTKMKDHAVSNVRLAKENISRKLYRWIIRDRMLGKKWKPRYLEDATSPAPIETSNDEKSKKNKKPKKEELSTKVLADVVESLIGAAYLHGGLELGYECAKFFNLGLKWEPIPSRVDAILSRVTDIPNPPQELTYVESILGYTFVRKNLLIEALTHVSYEHDLHTPSYERMEFLGDSVLDMIVTDYLYHAPGKNYSPGHIHIRKSAVVNAHFLAYICLRNFTEVDASMPQRMENGKFELDTGTQNVHLYKCLLHSSPRIVDDHRNTWARFSRAQDNIEAALTHGDIYPWGDLTRLQAPKFFSDMVESLIGAVYLDSQGNLDVVRAIVDKLGIMAVLNRIAIGGGLDVLHPISRLSIWAAKHDKELKYKIDKVKGNSRCVIFVDGEDVATAEELDRGKASQEEVKFLAAEMAIKLLRTKNVDMNYSEMKRGSRSTKKKGIA